MYRRIQLEPPGRKVRPDAIAVAVYKGSNCPPADFETIDARCGGALSTLMKRSEFSAARGAVTTAYPARGVERLFVLGLGEAEPTDRPGGHAVRVAAAKSMGAAHASGVRKLELQFDAGLSRGPAADETARALGDGLTIANFAFDEFRGRATVNNTSARPTTSGLTLQLRVGDALRTGVQRALKIGESVNLARTLAATPPNVANPSYLVRRCRVMARQVGLLCTVIDARRARQLGMGGLLAVGAAGSTPPALICLEHRPARKVQQRPVLLVGKAITFDTGGYSIKPSANMDGMKYDKCGGMAVIGAMHAVARLNLPTRVVGLVPTAENMVSQKAYRPGDILTLSNGVTVEVTNTDAEGRLVLADALAYGCKTLKPRAVVDLATLTGGVVVALGGYCAGCFCPDERLAEQLVQAGQFTGDRLWRLPLWNEHRQRMKGTHGDLVNSAGREAHAIQGAAFLSHFVGETAPAKMPDIPWAHLDIAGVSDVTNEQGSGGLFPKGPTGFGVRLLVRWLETTGSS